jgi:PAS domain S-box-containing protein
LVDREARKIAITVERVVGGAVAASLAGAPVHAATLGDALPVPVFTAMLLGTFLFAIALAAAGITALRQRARRIEAADFLRLSFENMAHGAVVYDSEQRVAVFNRRYVEMLDMPPGSVFVGQSLANILRIQKTRGLHTGIDIEAFIAERYDEIRRGVTRRFEVEMPDGRTLVMRSSAAPGKLHVSSFIDISERKRLERLRQESEDRRHAAATMLDLTFENMAQGAIVFDADMRVVAFNRRFLELFELSPDVVFVGQRLADILRARRARGQFPAVDDFERYIVAVYDEMRRGAVRLQDHDLPNGRTIAGRSVSLANGMYIATFTDITERRRAELALKASEERIRAIVDHAADAIVAIDAAGVVRSINPATERIFGYAAGEIVGRSVRKLMPEQHPVWPQAGMPSLSGEAKGRRKDGTSFPLEMSYARTHLGDVGVLILRDVTTQKDMQAQLIHASKLATVGQMAAGLAHEMNQPLNVVRMAADNVLMRMERGEVDPAYITEKLDLIGAQAEKVGKMILHMRVFARTEAPDLKPFNPIDSLLSATRLMEHRLTLINIRLDVDVPERCADVLGRANQLEQVVINLISNASDAILDRPGPDPVAIGRIAVSLSEDWQDGTVNIRVTDTGGGIPIEIRDRIFDPFFTTKDVGKGTGLGLSICSTIVAEMNGRIDIGDTALGAAITVTLPIHATASGSTALAEERAS